MGCAFTLEIPMQRKHYPHNSSQMDVNCGLGALSRRASIDQVEALALRRSESWRYMLRQLGTYVMYSPYRSSLFVFMRVLIDAFYLRGFIVFMMIAECECSFNATD